MLVLAVGARPVVAVSTRFPARRVLFTRPLLFKYTSSAHQHHNRCTERSPETMTLSYVGRGPVFTVLKNAASAFGAWVEVYFIITLFVSFILLLLIYTVMAEKWALDSDDQLPTTRKRNKKGRMQRGKNAATLASGVVLSESDPSTISSTLSLKVELLPGQFEHPSRLVPGEVQDPPTAPPAANQITFVPVDHQRVRIDPDKAEPGPHVGKFIDAFVPSTGPASNKHQKYLIEIPEKTYFEGLNNNLVNVQINKVTNTAHVVNPQGYDGPVPLEPKNVKLKVSEGTAVIYPSDLHAFATAGGVYTPEIHSALFPPQNAIHAQNFMFGAETEFAAKSSVEAVAPTSAKSLKDLWSLRFWTKQASSVQPPPAFKRWFFGPPPRESVEPLPTGGTPVLHLQKGSFLKLSKNELAGLSFSGSPDSRLVPGISQRGDVSDTEFLKVFTSGSTIMATDGAENFEFALERDPSNGKCYAAWRWRGHIRYTV